MATWKEFEERSPDLAALARKLLWFEHHGGLNFAYLATGSATGRLRLHPVCPTIVDGRLYVVAEGKTPKKRDLLEDGRFALHSIIFQEGKDGQFYASGRATLANDPDTRAKVESSYKEWKFSPDEMVFELDLERAMNTKWDSGYIHTKWIEGKN